MGIWSWHSLHAPKWWSRRPVSPQRLQELWPTVHSLRLVVGIALLAVLFMIPILATALLFATLAALLGLILQAAFEPSPLFWTVPSEAAELFQGRKAWLNHAWNHRMQNLVRGVLGLSARVDGLADAEGFFMLTAGLSRRDVEQLAQSAWDELVQQADEKPVHACGTIRFVLTALLCAAGTLILQIWRDLEFPSALLCIVLSIAVAARLTPGTEKLLGRWMGMLAWQEEKAGTNLVQVEPVEIPKMFIFRGGKGFWVRRIAAGLQAPSERENERAVQTAAASATTGAESVPAVQRDLEAGEAALGERWQQSEHRLAGQLCPRRVGGGRVGV